MKKNLTLLFLLPTTLLHTQPATFKWADEQCQYESTYDPGKISIAQIKACYSLTKWDEFRIQYTPPVFTVEDIEQLSLDSLHQEYNAKKQKLNSLDLPDIAEWERIRQEIAAEIDQSYHLSKIAYSAYKSAAPTVLREFAHQDSCLDKYSEALITGGDRLLDVWGDLIAQQAEKNAEPDLIWARYQEQGASNEKHVYAKIDVLTFGWWNCAINYVDYFDPAKAISTFATLFVSTKKIHCDGS